MRKFKCISVNDGNKRAFTIGKIYETDDKGYGIVTNNNIKCDNISILKEMGEIKDLKFTEVFDEKEDKKMNKFKVGDRVEIIGNCNDHGFKIGETVELYDEYSINFHNHNGYGFRAKKLDGMKILRNIVRTKDLKYSKHSSKDSKTFTITTSDTTTTLTDGTHTTSINRYYTDKHDDMVALEEVVKKYKSEMEEINRPTKGKDLIGVYIPEGTKFRVINVEPHRRDTMVCIDEYVGKIGRFDYSSFTFTDGGFKSTAIFEEDYMNAIDKKNGRLCWRYDEVEILWEEK